ncbi:MAG TPA: DUF389 domain-containing protein [Acidimicrobiales bacterium]
MSPTDMTAALIDDLKGNDAVLNLLVSPARTHRPTGDTFHFDVLNGAANSVIEQLRLHGIVEKGAIVIETEDTLLSSAAEVAEREQPRFESFAPIWALVDAQIRADGIYPPSWFVLLVIAGVIGAIGILTNSQILIVAAMVVGPEYGAITAIARAGTRRDGRTARRGLIALGLGFTAAVIASLILALIIRAGGVTPRAFEIGVRPVSDLINSPNVLSVIVAVLAGIVGVISLTESRTRTLIGVFISVTTIPAAADLGLSVGYAAWHEALGSFLQLVLNVSILIVVGMIMFVVQRRIWNRVTPTKGPNAGLRPGP